MAVTWDDDPEELDKTTIYTIHWYDPTTRTIQTHMTDDPEEAQRQWEHGAFVSAETRGPDDDDRTEPGDSQS